MNVHIKISILVTALLASVLTAAVYLPAIDNGFVDLDDEGYVSKNAMIDTIDARFIGWTFTTFEMYNYHPLTWISYGLDAAVWGKNPRGFHATSVLLHAFNTFLVVWLVFRLLQAPALSPELHQQRSLRVAGLTGILFGIHPLHVESVAWISERKDVLYAFFLLLAILAYLDFARNRPGKNRKYYGLCLFFFVLALLSKPMAVTLPLVLLIVDFFPLRRLDPQSLSSWKKSLFEKLPFFGLSFTASVATIFAQKTSGELRPFELFTLSERLLSAVRGVFFYLQKFVVPAGLAPFYPMQTPVRFSLLDGLYIVLFLAITSVCFAFWRRRPYLLAAWLYFLLTLLPVLGIIQVGGHAAADRYAYLPLVGPMVLAALALSAWIYKAMSLLTFRRAAVVVSIFPLLAMLVILIFRTAEQISVWKDSISLWNREIQLYPYDVAVSYQNRARAYSQDGLYDRAIEDYTRAAELEPGNYRVYSARGAVYFKTGHLNLARDDFKRALSLRPNYYEALYYLNLLK